MFSDRITKTLKKNDFVTSSLISVLYASNSGVKMCLNTVCLHFSYEFSKFSQSLDFPSLACLHMPSVASAHAQ